MLVVGMSLVLTCQSPAGELNPEESNTLQAIRDADGLASYGDSINGTHIDSVDLTGPEVTDSTLEVLNGAPYLRELDLHGAVQITNRGLAGLRALGTSSPWTCGTRP